MRRAVAAAAICLAAAGCSVLARPDLTSAFLLPDETHAIRSRIRGTRLVLELERVAERNERRVLHWHPLDRVETTVAKGDFACLVAAERDGASYVVFAREDPPHHRHPVTRAWRIDLAAGRLVPEANPTGLECHVDECNDAEEE